MSAMAFVLAGLIMLVVAFTVWILAPREERRTALWFVLGGLIAAAIKVALFQQAPQWLDINPDSITYDLNARAFVEHWQGRAVAAEDFNLRGLKEWHKAGLHGPLWAPDDPLPYTSILGTHEWLYAAYVGIWYWLGDAPQSVAIWSNVLWAALFPAAAFGIALALGGQRKVALAAGIFGLLDPSAGVNASWLLKDTLTGFLAMATLWGMAAYMREASSKRIAVATLALTLLGSMRYVAFLGLVIAAALVASWGLFRQRYFMGAALLTALGAATIGFGVLYSVPQSVSSVKVVVLSAKGAVDTLFAKKGEYAADDTVLRWKEALNRNPVLAVVKSLVHSLFAPYPWVAIHPGLTWHSFSELYYPGVLFWMLCLPGIFTAVVMGMRRGEIGFWLVLLFLASQLAAYTIWQGEWSTRQRVFALPAFFALAAIGWHSLVSWWRSGRRTAGRG